MKKAIIYRVSLRFGLFILLANLSVGWMVARPGLAAEFDIVVIADKNTAIPGGSGNFAGFDTGLYGPSLHGGNVAFWGEGSGQEGIYTDIGGLNVVADKNTSIPSGYPGMSSFTEFDFRSLHGGNVVFYGNDAIGSDEEGIYTDIEGLNVVADKNTFIPSGSGNFINFGN